MWHFKLCSSAFGWLRFLCLFHPLWWTETVLVPGTFMGPTPPCSVSVNPRVHRGCAAQNCRTFPGVFLAREKHLCHLIMQAVGEPSCWSIRNAHLGCPQDGPLGTILGSSSRRWGWEQPCQGSHCPRAASQGCEFKIKSVYWISAVGALRYRSNRMILSQLYLELHIANAKR